MTKSPYAGLVSRLSALGTDAIVLTLAGLAIGALPKVMWEQLIPRHAPGWLAAISTTVAALLPWTYFTACWWLTGQTAGGRLFGVMIETQNRRPLSFRRSALRAAIGLLFAPLWTVGMLGVLFDDRRRAWHDRLFRTVVCYVERPERSRA